MDTLKNISKYKLSYTGHGLKAFLKLFTIKNVPDVSVAITDLLQGEVKEKILHNSTDINKTLIKIPKYVSFFPVSERQV